MRSLMAALAAALVLLPAAPAWAANQPPVVVDDAVTYRNDGGHDYVVPALANDSDPDGDPLVYTAVTPASMGNAYLKDGTLLYKPYLGNQGTDSFTYTVSDGQGNTASATVTATLWVDPPAPEGVAISSAGAGSVTLTWAETPRAVGYRIIRNGMWIASARSLTWTDTGLLADRQYEYRIVGVNEGLFGAAQSDPVWRQPQLPTPGAVFVGGTDAPTTLRVTWDGGGMSGPWLVYRDGSPIGTSPWASFEDTGLITGREYSYQVQLVGTPSPSAVSPASPLSTVVRGTPGVLSPIGRLFEDLGGTGGVLGPVTAPESAIPGGRQQSHQNGLILQQDGEAPLAVTRPLATAYISAGGAIGDLGFPVAEQESGLRDGGLGQLFEGGSIWESDYTPATVVHLFIEDGWAATGWEGGPLGYPLSAQVVLPGGVKQAFEGGAVYWSASTGSHGVSSPIYDRWAAAGYENGALGYPTSDEVASEKGLRQSFTGGTIWWSPSRGSQVVSARLQDAWARSGWEDGPLGHPLTGEIPLAGGGLLQRFQGGTMYWTPWTGAHPVYGGILAAWGRTGWENGPLGYPLTGEIPLAGGGRLQRFQGGNIYWTPWTGAYTVRGGILAAWGRTGWENGRLGYPTSEETGTASTRRQTFQRGTITYYVATGRQTITYR